MYAAFILDIYSRVCEAYFRFSVGCESEEKYVDVVF